MTPTTHRVKTTVLSPLGPLLLAATPSGLSGVWFMDQRYLPAERQIQDWTPVQDNAILNTAAAQLTAYFEQRLDRFELPLDLSAGTAFQSSVWRALLDIPFGQTRSYGELARAIGKRDAVRAVGAAIGRNPLGIVVPCHRVVGAQGALTGYAGGLDRKAALLRLEGALIDKAHQSQGQTTSTGNPTAQPLPAH
ncbi:methylated-DNA--[protein]-cysteine S-methyltransferase [Hydrogenophaga sp. A37]|uniref:methylated-DNA--[protein]-cysteine S-methyltransferase n=1 Tax=Hydrogenophaga sp. A37 TaxID=1945864 RepID=UPI0009877A93|nr:methylated-DNA--[protein]-cysteine S-methyltransferase [Hydrogenophaga sp. A37]OOG79121.1 cysteine methyltransferase [Hydrogenophaga sp. A37]